ncbi:MAG: hypothetical protein AMK73_02890 [Planctomycetes bacterium SM23_32]|nr:MAG: hypothetical protein AMK73_02890 [Planctomycetes bacterium SM23_32]
MVSVAAFAILMLGRRRPLRGDARALLATALALTVFRNASNCLEWLGGVGGLEPLEDYVDTLSPLMWGFFFYVVFQALRQRELRESEERHRILLASLPQRIFYKDAQSRFVLVNEKFAADLGMEPDGVVGKTDRDFYPPREVQGRRRASNADPRAGDAGRAQRRRRRRAHRGGHQSTGRQ